MQARKSTSDPAHPAARLPAAADDPRQRQAVNAARPTVPQPRIERLAGPFRVKPGYLERRAWPFGCGD